MITDQEFQELIEKVRRLTGLELEPGNFERIDGEWLIDGMDPDDWVDAMVMD